MKVKIKEAVVGGTVFFSGKNQLLNKLMKVHLFELMEKSDKELDKMYTL